MGNILLIKSILIFIILWGASLLLLFFRGRIEYFWKIIASLIYIFYIWFFFDEISSGFLSLQSGWYPVVIGFLKELLSLSFINMFFFWPLALIIIFYKADEIGAENLLKFMCILTLVLWIIFVIYVYFNKGINEFLFEQLRNMIPFAN
ncbi:MAG: hypothetical protein SVR08_01400 [Spirochaetota bacterium]|nr:hypothetical protein [Spirochaetota bacterium]